MTEIEFDAFVARVGISRARHTARTFRSLMPTLIYTAAGAKTLAFIKAVEAAIDRAECPRQPPEDVES